MGGFQASSSAGAILVTTCVYYPIDQYIKCELRTKIVINLKSAMAMAIISWLGRKSRLSTVECRRKRWRGNRGIHGGFRYSRILFLMSRHVDMWGNFSICFHFLLFPFRLPPPPVET